MINLYSIKEVYPHRAGYKEKRGCAEEAANKLAPKLKKLQMQVLYALCDYGYEGTTAEHLAEGMELDPATVKPRISELRLLGRVEATGVKGKTRLGGTCAVWRAIITGE